MRVVAGELGGRLFEAPPGLDTRPTTDKVREAVFNALGSLDLVRDAAVADLFAGSGALGIEALSRGAAHCTFVERDRRALRTIRENLRQLDLADRSRVVAGDAAVLVGGLDVDIVFVDPPYEFDAWPELLRSTRAPFVVAEAGRSLDRVDGVAELDAWEITRTKRYGRTWVTFLERTGNT
ncbi:MAG: 16S rRNA (guanine(966)-N(2))-methyltransferase RsmD [Ilumatobacter sp.]|uniref:16S rRNA (guanine(966)-N(2))-methyltransferase RsmD n=1 Tax=Ilumatobacter sp. TaxID=1967498 RepID=UPI002616DEAE|nr:16S rRNA (guanine(966)-N(2))-methyltransferase RsmD [Ilumatobacter sp.]MDJ0770759.1 16S rRNA (guanine(966)-N(2))-methyltransferase RsmD [Ilumatobacter sp.]